MKKKALIQDFKIEVKKSITRFLSILLIVALGVAFFSGIRASQPDMKISADQYYDDSNFMDIRIISTMGLTEEDVEAIRRIEGIKEAEPAFSLDVLCKTHDTEEVVKVMSLTDKLNKIHITEGRLPENTSECLVDTQFLENTGYKLGDTINFSSGTDENLEESLSNTSYTIVGAGNSAFYLSFVRGSTSIGNGKIGSFAVIPSQAFKMDAYTEIYAAVKDALELTSYTKQYDDTVEIVVNQIENIADARTEARYEQVLEEPRNEIEEAKEELSDKENEVNKELEDARIKLEDGKKEIADGEVKLAEGKAELEQGKAKLNANKEKLEASEAELKEGKKKLEASEEELNSGKKLLSEKRQEYRAGLDMFNGGYRQWQDNMDSWKISSQEMEDKEAAILTALEDLYKQKSELEPAKDLYPNEWRQLLSAEEDLLQKQDELKTGRETLEKAKLELDAVKLNLDRQKEKLEAADQTLAGEEQNIITAEAVIAEKRKEVDKGLKQLESGRQEIEKAETEIEESKKALAESEAEIIDAKAVLEEKEKEYQEGVRKAENEISDAKRKIGDAEEKLKDVDYPEWYVLDRNSIQTYVEYGQDAERIGNIGRVFPVIFFLVAALVSLTTMTRMVEEQRTQIGTLKALGYSKKAIAGKYILYSLSASLIGSIIGVLVGEQVLPQVIIKAYAILYKNLPKVISPYNIYNGAISTLIAVACTTLAAFFSCYKELMSEPAQLMRPAAPKLGKRVMLERIPWLWRCFNFTTKATVRNLLRYKKRFFMTVFGIGGCMSLLLVGFGLKDSIGAMSDIQYVDLWHQDATVTVKADITDQETDELLQQLKGNEHIKEAASVLDITVDAGKDKVTKSTSLIVPKNPEEITDYIVFRDRITHRPAKLTDDGVIITEKLASLLKVSAGDTILIKNKDTVRVEAKVTAISENYMLHYIFMTPKLYEKLYGEAPDYNKIYLKMPDNKEADEKVLAADILKFQNAASISYTSDFQKQINDMLTSLNLVVYVLITAAGLLAFIVLYNLNNININERKRELATIKVLGFQDLEVAEYVYRENILLTVIGTLAGIVMGIALHRLVILTTEIDSMMFGRNIRFMSYIFSILLTFGFSIFVNYVMFYKLRKINMVESLKSVE